MSYSADKKPGELTALTSLATDDVIVVGDTSDTSEVAKGITKANLITDLTTSFATSGHNHTGVYEPANANLLETTDIGVSVASQSHNHTGVYAPVLGADDNYVTDAEKAALHTHANLVALGNVSGTNTGDQDLSALAPKASPTFTGTVTMPVALTGVLRADTGVVSVDTDVTDIVASASSTAQGKVELATDAETVTGTDTVRATTPANITAKMSAPGAIGNTTASTGKFTSVETTGNIELGHATDTTLSRSSAGVLAVEGVVVPTISSTNTLSNKSISGALTLEENASIALDPAGSADGKYSGITVTGTGGATIAFGDLVTLDKDDSRWELVDISVAAAATGDARGILGMAVTSSSDGGALTILLNGIIRADANFPALTIGAPVYASTTGDIVVAQPTTTDYVIRQVGYALTADEIYFNPTGTWTTHV